MRGVSSKQASINRQMKILFQERLLEFDGKCTGCGTRYSLTPSHLIRRSKRPDLILDKRNVKPHCIRCAELWDSGVIEKMKLLNDFEENMDFIRLVDINYLYRLAGGKIEVITKK